MITSPVFSVIVLSYNHEKYVENALRSVLSQTNAPPHEILVADDVSTDRTRELIVNLSQEFPDKFQLLERDHNLGLSANLENAWQQCRGEYISILEGDDQWIDPCKLQKIAAALAAHPEWTGCFHTVKIRCELPQYAAPFVPMEPWTRPLAPTDFISHNVIPTYSCMTYRRGIITRFPAGHRGTPSGDWILNFMHAEHGGIGYLPDVMTEYRAHAQGMGSGQKDVARILQHLHAMDVINDLSERRYDHLIAAAKQEYVEERKLVFEDLRKIERRYHLLRLDRIAAAIKWLRETWQRIRFV